MYDTSCSWDATRRDVTDRKKIIMRAEVGRRAKMPYNIDSRYSTQRIPTTVASLRGDEDVKNDHPKNAETPRNANRRPSKAISLHFVAFRFRLRFLSLQHCTTMGKPEKDAAFCGFLLVWWTLERCNVAISIYCNYEHCIIAP